MNTKNYLIIYHKEDNDGLFSGVLFYDYLINVLKVNKEDIETLGADYNILANFAKKHDVEELYDYYKCIIMTDISFNDYNYMKSLWNTFKYNFIWCDHHAPIINASFKYDFGNIPGIRDTKRSAILCVWKYLYDPFDESYNKKEVPELLRILSAWDSWTYKQEGYDFDYVRNINKGTTAKLNLNINDIIPLIRTFVEIYVDNKKNTEFSMKQLIENFETYGAILNKYEDQTMENIINISGDTSWKIRSINGDNLTWRPACAIFHQGATNSTMFKSVREQCANGIVFKHAKNGNWTVSLYNTDDTGNYWDNKQFHCGEFCKTYYNGGGHAGAAGFTINQDKFIEILKNKIL